MEDKETQILVVEDSPTTRQQITKLLIQAGYEAVSAQDGEEALSLASELHPELVILDIVLPKKNGYQVCRSIKNNPDLAVKVMMLTSKCQEKDRLWGARQGADAYLAKPIDSEELLGAVETFLIPANNH